MGKDDVKFYMVREDALPESIQKTAQVKEMLARGEAKNILEAVQKVNLARSTFYKYKDGVFSLFDAQNMNILTITLLLKHISGILSGVLNCIASQGGNILTINQNLPMNGVALVTLTISAKEMPVSGDELLMCLRSLEGVVSVELVAKS